MLSIIFAQAAPIAAAAGALTLLAPILPQLLIGGLVITAFAVLTKPRPRCRHNG